MFYTIYQITNLLDGKIYIGKHQTKCFDDGYMGSGKILRRAIKKYGEENFKKEILFVFETEDEMNAKEAELVNEEFVARADTYNLCFGGRGGFAYINKFLPNGMLGKQQSVRQKTKAKELMLQLQVKLDVKEIGRLGGLKSSGFSNRSHTEETKQKMSIAISAKARGSQNSQFGTMWITNGTESRKIKKDLDNIPEGWYKGRKIARPGPTPVKHRPR